MLRRELDSGCEGAAGGLSRAPGALQGLPHAELCVLDVSAVRLVTHLEPLPLLRAAGVPHELQRHDLSQLEPGLQRCGELRAAGQRAAHESVGVPSSAWLGMGWGSAAAPAACCADAGCKGAPGC